MPAITVGMPVLNGEVFLEHALRSLSAQSFGDFALVVSDNGSTDRTPEILAEAAEKDRRIRVIRQASNIGGLPNFRFVLEAAETEFFMWAAYDDWHEPDYLEKLHWALTRDKALGLAVPSVARMKSDTEVSARTEPPVLSGLARSGRAIALMRGSQGGWIYGLFRREAVRRAFDDAVAAFPEPWAGDHLTVLPFLVNDITAAVPETTFYQRETGLSDARYRPKTAGELWPFMMRFMGYGSHVISQSRLNPWEKTLLYAYLPRYAGMKAEKWNRVFRRTLFGPWRREE